MKILANYLSFEEQQALEGFFDDWYNNHDKIHLQTSGSTGDKKSLFAQKVMMQSSAKMTGNFFKFSDKSTLLHCLPISFIAGKMMAVRAITYNTNVIFTSPTKPISFDASYPIDFAAMTPHQYSKCLTEDPEKLDNIKTILLGGGTVHPQLEANILDQKHRVFHSYGMTETYSHVALRELGKQSNFKALDNIHFSQGENGDLQIHAPILGIDGLKTNDIVDLLNPYEFRFIGRKDFVVNSGGIKLQPEELERKLSGIIGNRPFFMAGVPCKSLGEKLVLFVEGTDTVDAKQFLNVLNNYEKPKDIIYCGEFCLTETGKLDRKKTILTYLR
jgi:O-succinylbenzoic acid--CoA ligase